MLSLILRFSGADFFFPVKPGLTKYDGLLL